MYDKTIFGASDVSRYTDSVVYPFGMPPDYKRVALPWGMSTAELEHALAERSRLVAQSLKHADELQDLRGKIAMLVSENSSLKNELALLRLDPSAVNKRIGQLESIIDMLRGDLASYRNEIAACEERFNAINRIINPEHNSDD